MSFLDKIQLCNNWQRSDYLPWLINGQIYGWILPSFAEHLKAWSEVFHIDEQTVVLNPKLDTYQKRTDALVPIIESLHQQGVIDTWVDEQYPVNLAFGEQGMLEYERAATLYFGSSSYGIHVNGLVQKADGIHVWVGVRTLDKPFYPGKFDQMVAGGQPVGIGLQENLIKEAAEEANIQAELAATAKQVSQLTYRQNCSRGLDQSIIYNYDLWLPEDFVPENTDGEVSEFILMPIQDIYDITESSLQFKDNCNLVNIDLLIRHGVLNEQHADFEEIVQQLYATST